MTKPIINYHKGRTDTGKPRPAPHMFPYLGHRTMAQIMDREDQNNRNLALGRLAKRK